MKIKLSSLFLTVGIFVSLTGICASNTTATNTISTNTTFPTTSSFAILPEEDIKLTDSEFVKAEKGFNYGKSNNETVPASTWTIKKVEALLNKHQDFSLLSAVDKEARGKLYSRAGAYDAHVKQDYNSAIAKMKFADKLISDKKDKAWNYTQLAYSYERKFALNNQETDKLQAQDYIGKAFSNLTVADNDALALLYCLQGRLFQDDHDHLIATWHYNQALFIYTKIQFDSVKRFITIKDLFDLPFHHGMTFIDDRARWTSLRNVDTACAYCDVKLS